MQFILRPIIKYGLFIFYLFLVIISLVLTFRQKVYHKTAFAKTSTNISGYLDARISGAKNFIYLSQDNQTLQKEIMELREQNALLKEMISEMDTLHTQTLKNTEFMQTYKFIPAEVINNSIAKDHNMITINKGARHGVDVGMGVISSHGVIGRVIYTTENYARVISTLNRNTRLNARVRGNDYFGTLIWDAKDPRFVNLTEIPKYIKVEKGDTIETDGKSSGIPGGIRIGIVESAKIDELTGELDIKVRLDEDFARLRYVQVIVNLKNNEIQEVERDSILQYAQP